MSAPVEFDPPKPEELSQLLNGYDVTDLIATGGMGAVYRANQISLDRPVAIKLLPSELNDPTFREQFQAEARAMARLNHPNLIGIYDFGQADGMPYIVMELVNGKSLYYSSYGKAVDQTTACEIIIGICRGLAHAHGANIIHRDIKPANILLDANASPKIGDFGLASASDADHDGGPVFGTPGYAAPEILASEQNIGIPSDLYAVGVILYELLTGKMPDEPASPPSTISSCDSRLDPIFRRATRRNPAMRYQSATEIADDLAKLLPTLGKSSHAAIRTGNTAATSKSVPMKRNTGEAAAARTADSSPPKHSLRRLTPADQSASASASKPKLTRAPERNPNSDPGETPVASPVIAMEPGSNWPIIRNMMIIAVLIPTIIFAWGKYQDKQDRLKKERDARELKEKAAAELRTAIHEKERRAAETRQLREQKAAERNKAFAESGTPTDSTGMPTPPKPVEKSPLEQLADLKSRLASGSRNTYPEGTIDRSNYAIFIVETPMTWTAASEFAEEHGAHLATPTTDADLGVITKRMTGDLKRVWIGGGASARNGWSWVTGEEWNYRDPATTLGSCASLTHTGVIKARPNGEKNPFVIQWSADGSNPGAITAQLSRLAPTLGSPSPAWPPTAVAQDNRVFLLVHKPLSWDEADFIAGTGKGHLAIASDPLETLFIRDHLIASLGNSESAWLGGRRSGDTWAWSTGEPWTKASWQPNSPDGGPDASALRFVKNASDSGWDDASPDAGNAESFLIEWSTDSEQAAANGSATPAANSDGELVKLRLTGRRFVSKRNEEQLDKLRENQKNLMWNLSTWHRVQSKSAKEQYEAPINALEAGFATTGILPEGLPVANLPPIAAEYYAKALERQSRFQKDFEASMENLRQSYLGKLLELRDKLEASGQKSQVEQVNTEIKEVGQNAASFLAHFQ
ncbi:protein kinase [Verrucomicrobiaceae bacterium 227]